jgi:Raf kinase inhibitor-like YbhB/YbcL family protein
MRGVTAVLPAVLILAIVILGGCGTNGGKTAEGSIPKDNSTHINYSNKGEVGGMRLTSNAFSEGGKIPDKYACKGLDISPQLVWEDVPAGTKSFALIMDDPDAPVGLWTHWMVKNIPPDRRTIGEQEVAGIEVVNSAGNKSYHGPCPPSGTHRYFFRLYALDVPSLPANTKADFYKEVEQHKLAVAQLMGRYTR